VGWFRIVVADANFTLHLFTMVLSVLSRAREKFPKNILKLLVLNLLSFARGRFGESNRVRARAIDPNTGLDCAAVPSSERKEEDKSSPRYFCSALELK
jgi:hypothetical protein